jgi:UDP-3-O-[3-hydroxymyristoyl] glucosamine N-acyltransferase
VPLRALDPRIGQCAQNAEKIDADVILGHRYPGDKLPTRIGDYAIIRSGSIIYADTVIGHRFQCGHQVIIRAEVTIGDRWMVHHRCTLQGRLRIGHGVKIMAHVYLPSRTAVGNMVFIGPGTTFLNARYPMREGMVQGATARTTWSLAAASQSVLE